MRKRSTEGTDKLSEVAFFDGFSAQERARVVDLSTELDVPARTVLIDQGAAGVDCFVVLEGTAAIYIGADYVTSVGKGNVLGEMALVDHRPRSASVIAETPMKVLRFDARRFKTLLSEMPKAEERIMATLTARLRENS